MIAYTHGNEENESVVRQNIEHVEETVLGSQSHTKLEMIEPMIDKVLPYFFFGISILFLIIAYSLHLKEKGKIKR